MRRPLPYFIDSSAWIALAITSDPHHERAKESWQMLHSEGAASYTSIPILLETFTFLDRNTDRKTAWQWKELIQKLRALKILECTLRDVEKSWLWFQRRELYKLSAVDATSFALMERHRIRRAFTFDTHFSIAGFALV